MYTIEIIFFTCLCLCNGLQISYQINAIDDEICKSADENSPLEWHDDACHKFKCEKIDGKERIVVTSCQEPVFPSNALECKKLKMGGGKFRYPICCPKLLCMIEKEGKIYLHLSGQPGHNFTDEPMINKERLLNIYKVLSSRKRSRSRKVSTERISTQADESQVPTTNRTLTKRDTVFSNDWM